MLYTTPLSISLFLSFSGQTRTLPYLFADPLVSSDCVFSVAALSIPPRGDEEDVFSTQLIAEVAKAIATACLDTKRPSVGAHIVGPKGVLAVVMKSRRWELMGNGTGGLRGGGGGNGTLNASFNGTGRLVLPGFVNGSVDGGRGLAIGDS